MSLPLMLLRTPAVASAARSTRPLYGTAAATFPFARSAAWRQASQLSQSSFGCQRLPPLSVRFYATESASTTQQQQQQQQPLDSDSRAALESIKQIAADLKQQNGSTTAALDAKQVLLQATSAPTAATPSTPTTAVNASTTDAAVAKKKPLWPRIKEEVMHLWHGTKLLALEVRLSSRYILKLMRGNKLTRREQRQLRRTVADMLRLVPMVVLFIIPFAELALPFLLKLFPNMLPSTFERQFEQEEKKKKVLKGRLEIAKFLRETVSEMSIAPDPTRAAAVAEFTQFFRKIRSSGEQANTEDLLKVARNFEDELTLENLSRPQLVSMSKYMGIKAFGTDNFLRFQIRTKMRQLKMDDKLIQSEGVDSLSIPELQKACQDRGIKTLGVSPARLRYELQQWLDLHLVHKIPSSLLILSRAFIMSDKPQFMKEKSDEAVAQPTADALHATLQSLPESLINEAELKIHEDEGKASYKKRLEVLQEQEELIAEELAQEAREQAAERERKELEASAAASAATAAAAAGGETAEAGAAVEEDVRISEEQLKELSEALQVLSSKSAVDNERAELAGLREDKKKDADEGAADAPPVKESSASTRLGSRMEKLISKITTELEQYDSEIGSKLNLIQANEAGQVTVGDLEEVLKIIRSKPEDDERIKKIVKKLDVDNDGLVTVEELLALAKESQEKEGHGVVVAEDKDPAGDKKTKAAATSATPSAPLAVPPPPPSPSGTAPTTDSHA
ncbi:LETM1 domain-containing protein ylh47 [Sorochytrium milnesiophthora]